MYKSRSINDDENYKALFQKNLEEFNLLDF